MKSYKIFTNNVRFRVKKTSTCTQLESICMTNLVSIEKQSRKKGKRKMFTALKGTHHS